MVLPSAQHIAKKRSMRSISSSSSEISITDGSIKHHQRTSNDDRTAFLRRLRSRSIADRDDCYLVETAGLCLEQDEQSAIARISQRITPISNIPYIHSSYAAASPTILDSPKWMHILKTLMPNLDFTIQRSDRMIQQCENNPVMAAFGVLNSKHVAPLEWDIFLDPKLVCQYSNVKDDEPSSPVDESLVCRMMLAHGSAAQLLMEATGVAQQWNFEGIVANQEVNKIKSGMFVHTWLQLFASALQMGTADITADDESDGEQVDDRRKMLMSPSILNQSFRSTRSFSRVDYSNKPVVPEYSVEYPPPMGNNNNSASNNSYCLSNDYNSSGISRICGLMSSYLMSEDEEMVENRNRMRQIRNSIQIIQQVLGQPLALILDLKSRFVPSRVWSRLVRTLESLGLSIHAIGSFDIPELREITVAQTQKYLFFHSAGDFQKAVIAKEIQEGDTIFFNAGSLIAGKRRLSSSIVSSCCIAGEGDSFGNTSSSLQSSLRYQEQIMDDGALNDNDDDDDYYGGLMFYMFAYPNDHINNNNNTKKKTLQDYQQRYKLQIGLYVQEVAIGPDELDGLVQFINKYRSIYNIGLAWGGLDECHFQDIQGTGYGTQRYVGTNWDITS
mmetsp:Transcript_29193/g.43063  ORF Transcript_29193/g.43063 Transcript_29193/m.43063 type:complete len:614 (+) Transcript_29193:100-1941(+)